MILKILRDPFAVLVSALAGVACGLYAKPFAHGLEPLANIYISLLSMCLLPILLSALTWGIGQLLRHPKTSRMFRRVSVMYLLGLLVPSSIAVAVALLIEPGTLMGADAAAALGADIKDAETSHPQAAHGLVGFVERLAPRNIFNALSTDDFVSIVFFSALAGLGLGVVRSPGADEALRVLNALYGTFTKVLEWVLTLLPIGLFAIVASTVAAANSALIVALGTYVGGFWIAGIAVFIVHVTFLALVTRSAPWRLLLNLRRPLILGFVTDNPIVALKAAIDALQKKFKVEPEVAETIVPFGVLANQHGQIVLLAFTAIFFAQVYGVDLDPFDTATIIIGTTIAGAAAIGGGAILAPIIAPVLLSADIPTALSVTVLATTQPAVANLGSLLTVQATSNLAAITGLGDSRGAPAPAGSEAGA